MAWREVVIEAVEDARREEAEEREEERMLAIVSRAQLNAKCRDLHGTLQRSRDQHTPAKDPVGVSLVRSGQGHSTLNGHGLQFSHGSENMGLQGGFAHGSHSTGQGGGVGGAGGLGGKGHGDAPLSRSALY